MTSRVGVARPLRERGRAAFLCPPRAGHRGRRLGHRPLERADRREVRRVGLGVVRWDARSLRRTRPTVPPRPSPVRHEATAPAAWVITRGDPSSSFYLEPTTEQRYTSSVSTRVISGLVPAAAARTCASETNWWGANPSLKTMRT